MWVIILLKRFAFVFCFLFIIPFTCYGADDSASSAVVIDADTKTILYEKNAYECRSMASTTKIMTALLAIESNMLDNPVVITAEMLDTEGSSLGLNVDDKITLNDLVVGMMMTSGNDSANAVAYFLGKDLKGFAQMMNSKAKEIGMKSTVFVTPSGLDEGEHHSTAYDMALLGAYAVKNETFAKVSAMKSADITISNKKVTVYNHNKLLAMDENFFGIKTGYTSKAGRCLVSAKKCNGNSLICVTLNAPDDWNDHIRLMNECGKKYKKQTVNAEVKIPVVGSDAEAVSCKYKGEYYALGEVTVKLYYHPFVYAPIKKGDTIGVACVYKNNELIERLPMKADEDLNYAKQERSQTTEVYG